MTDAQGHDASSSAAATTPAARNERLDKALERTSRAPLRTGNRLALLQNGPDTFDDWLSAIARAEKWVHLDNYIFQDDAVGRRFADVLKEKAASGVTVRVLSNGSAPGARRIRSGGRCAARAWRYGRSTRLRCARAS